MRSASSTARGVRNLNLSPLAGPAGWLNPVPRILTPLRGSVLLLLLLAMPAPLSAQVDEAKAAIDRKEYVRAVNLLSEALAGQPSADVYLYLGIAYTHMREWQKAENVFREGVTRFAGDPRFYSELADVYLSNNDTGSAKDILRAALAVDAHNAQASDLLATIEMSEGEIRSALHSWNRIGRPVVGDILHNSHRTFGHWTVSKAMALHPEGVLRFAQWRTTQARLMETGLFTNAGIDIEPAPIPNRYTANIQTTAKANSLEGLAFNLLKGAPAKTSYLDLWNLDRSGVSINANYRWDANRRRGELHVHAPIPLPGILYIDASGLWRSEHWDLTPVLRANAANRSQFRYKSTGARIELKHIPDYRFEIGAGFEYDNRAASGELPELLTDSRNAGKILLQTTIRLVDSRYQNRLHAEAYVARKGFLGDLNYGAGTLEFNNRLALSSGTKANSLNWTIKAGTSRGRLPVEEYFILGLDTAASHVLRGHTASKHGRYGSGPMGTDFALVNTEFEHRLAVLPLFNLANLPYVEIKAEVFVDAAKTFDRARLFKQGKLLVDAGAGLKLQTPTRSLNLTYGRSLREGSNVFYASIEKRW